VHWAPTVFNIGGALYTCFWASSLLTKKDIFDRDSGLNMVEYERTNANSRVMSYTQTLLEAAFNSKSDEFHRAPGTNICVDGPGGGRNAASAGNVGNASADDDDDDYRIDVMPKVLIWNKAKRRDITYPDIYLEPTPAPTSTVSSLKRGRDGDKSNNSLNKKQKQ
jgi:hypothetical protein